MCTCAVGVGRGRIRQVLLGRVVGRIKVAGHTIGCCRRGKLLSISGSGGNCHGCATRSIRALGGVSMCEGLNVDVGSVRDLLRANSGDVLLHVCRRGIRRGILGSSRLRTLGRFVSSNSTSGTGRTLSCRAIRGTVRSLLPKGR